MNFRSLIRDIHDFPTPGIIFRDITPLLRNRTAFNSVVSAMADMVKHIPDIDHIVGIESRGFILGSALAYKMGIGFIPIRKPGKLPGWTVKQEYSLEYGQGSLEICGDAILDGDRVVIVDDVLATGGTAEAANRLISRLKGVVVANCFLVELTGLNGRAKLANVHSLVQY
jgi:adenine phosphoribosyltransferase